MAAWVVWQLCHYFLGEARRRDQPGSRLRDGLEWSGGQGGVQSQRAGSAAGPPCRLPTPLLRWNLPGVIFAREQESRPPLSSAHSPGPTHSGLAPACQEGEARKRRDQKRGSRPAALLGAGGPAGIWRGPGPGRVPSPGGARAALAPPPVASPCYLTLGSPGRPTTKKLRPRQQLAVSSQELRSQ